MALYGPHMQLIAQIGLTMRYTMSKADIDTSWLEHLATVIAREQTEKDFDEEVNQLIADIIWSYPVPNLVQSSISNCFTSYSDLGKRGN